MYAYFVCCSLSYLWVEEKARCKQIFLNSLWNPFLFSFSFLEQKEEKDNNNNKRRRRQLYHWYLYVYQFLTKMIPRCKFWSGQVLDEARSQSRGFPLTRLLFDRHMVDVWPSQGRCLTVTRLLFDRHMVDVWPSQGWCLTVTRLMFDRHKADVWPSQGRCLTVTRLMLEAPPQWNRECGLSVTMVHLRLHSCLDMPESLDTRV